MTLGLFCLGSAKAAGPGFLWAKQSGSENWEYAAQAATDNKGNSFAIGRFANALTFGTNTLTGSGLFIARYNATGDVVWARRVGPPWFGAPALYTLDWGARLSADNLGGAVLLATGTSADFGNTNLSSGGPDNSFFLARYLADGSLAWARGSTSNMWGGAVAVDAAGNSFVTGVAGPITAPQSIFIAKFDPNGNALWIKTNEPSAFGLTILKDLALTESGEIVICGHTRAPTLTFGSVTLTNAGSFDVFVARFDVNGDLLWLKRGGGVDHDYAINVAIDGGGNAYLSGVGGNTDQPDPRTTISFGNSVLENVSYFQVKYSPTGDVLWARKAAEFTLWPFLERGIVGHSACDREGNSYLFGEFDDTVTLGNVTLTNTSGGVGRPNFVGCYDSNGNVKWAKQFGRFAATADSQEGGGMACDKFGRVVIAAAIYSTDAMFDTTSFNAVGDTDVVVARIDADRPNLNLTHVGTALTLSWPTNYAGYTLEYADDAGAGSWTADTNSVAVSAPNFQVNASAESAHKFYRLRKP